MIDMKRVAIVQSNYIPWKGYFDLIASVDEFVLYDEVQYTKRDWRNRNRIRTRDGTQWLTIPVQVKGRYHQTITETEVVDDRWASQHWRVLKSHYARARFFESLGPKLESLYHQAAALRHLSAINELFLRWICEQLGIRTTVTRSETYPSPGDRNERLVGICTLAGATSYLSGPAARSYLDDEVFRRAGIELRWMAYDGYPEYRQMHGPPFVHEVTILDLLLNVGPEEVWGFLLSERPKHHA
jgi:hypothetical protein